ncbi:MAG: nucleotidyltransferase family protein [Candidatus Woesearchaeota archaeon]
MAKPQKIETIARITVPIMRKNGVIKAGIFGSAARGKLKKNSDIDFLIKFKRGKSLLDLVRLKHQLEDKLGRDVDLVEYSTIKPRIKERILNEEVKIL